MIALLLAAALADPAVAPASPVGPVQHLKEVVIEAIRNCPKAAAGEIVVCSPDKGYSSAYRLPQISPRLARAGVGPSRGPGPLTGVGGSGQGSCGATGGGGATGCSLNQAHDWGDWKKQQKAEGREFPW